ncbi:MAG: phospholipase [Paramuribaculum sp.]|nr:phospholipase [Paramuribaculum sp.]
MIVALYILIALIAVGSLLYLLHRRDIERNGDQDSAPQQPQPEEEECCGMHITCEKDSLLAAVSSEIVYYDDEELDIYRGKDPSTYTSEQTEQFRDVLLTLLPDDIAGWARSIQLRGIHLPPDVKDELIMIVAEERQRKNQHTSA